MAKIFNKKITPYCKYCIRGSLCKGTDTIICIKKGVTDINDSCRHFKYDPLKRVPLTPKAENNFTTEDFKL